MRHSEVDCNSECPANNTSSTDITKRHESQHSHCWDLLWIQRSFQHATVQRNRWIQSIVSCPIYGPCWHHPSIYGLVSQVGSSFQVFQLNTVCISHLEHACMHAICTTHLTLLQMIILIASAEWYKSRIPTLYTTLHPRHHSSANTPLRRLHAKQSFTPTQNNKWSYM
jgi:hypothetical protein